jgi:hypothetical protein
MDVDIDNLKINVNAQGAQKNLSSGNPEQRAQELEWIIEQCVERVLKRLENKT